MSLVLNLEGSLACPEVPCLQWTGDRPDSAAIEAGLKAAAADGHAHVGICWDPMDGPGLAMLQQLGFTHTGQGPWRNVGGAVHWIHGYEDATGAWIDLSVKLP